MDFRSDNTAPAAPEILVALAAVNEGPATAYGEDQWSKRLDAAFGAVFEHEVRVFPVSSGTAANAIALASATPSWGAVICHREAHIERDEGGAPEFYSDGAKLFLADGPLAKLTPAALTEVLTRNGRDIHATRAHAFSISQANERGVVYRPEEIAALSAVARRENLAFHMDGARFANALAAVGCTPAELSWKAGVELLSFGATKNGALGAEAIVVFDSARAEEIARRRKRGGHLVSKSRFVAAQFLAYLENGLWLSLARRANELARRMGDAAGALLSAPVETNQLFLQLDGQQLMKLREAGVGHYEWGRVGSNEVRLVVSWNQAESDVEAFCKFVSSIR